MKQEQTIRVQSDRNGPGRSALLAAWKNRPDARGRKTADRRGFCRRVARRIPEFTGLTCRRCENERPQHAPAETLRQRDGGAFVNGNAAAEGELHPLRRWTGRRWVGSARYAATETGGRNTLFFSTGRRRLRRTAAMPSFRSEFPEGSGSWTIARFSKLATTAIEHGAVQIGQLTQVLVFDRQMNPTAVPPSLLGTHGNSGNASSASLFAPSMHPTFCRAGSSVGACH